ncbi:hypothetical protein V6N13_125803 [Hibiscus sabdariffa]|uniref:RNase H type-1 domain-containing protein n=1 Tax=Hibiscus sabdariffa TaxID=183260 RepID=A0ABR2U6R6_9ROSI
MRVVLFASDLGLHAMHAGACGQVPTSHVVARWSSPPVGWYKLNVDDVYDHLTSFVACKGLIREHGGIWVRGFVRSVCVCLPIEVELWAVHESLVQAWMLGKGKKHVTVEVDSTLVLRLLSSHSHIVVSMTILQHIFALLSGDWSVKFDNSFGEANIVPNKLAKSIVLYSLEFWVFIDPSLFILQLLHSNYIAAG